MSSGVKVTDEVKALFETMKVKKKDDVEGKHPRFATFVIEDGKIVVHKIIREEDLKEEKDHFKFFRSQLPDNGCCYALYDCYYTTCESSTKEDLVFFMWAPDNLAIKDKMCYASSKGPLAQAFNGVKFSKQINDPSEYKLDLFVDLFGKDTVSVEGCCVTGSQRKQK